MKPNKSIPSVVHEMINDRISRLSNYLEEKAPHVVDEQVHLHDDTEERAYWHYGYMQALRDIQNLLNQENSFDSFNIDPRIRTNS